MVIFQFRQFAVSHANSSMRIGTDAVLLGAWAQVTHARNILDIGTGCGIIALMLAQKNPEASILAIDIDSNSIEEANLNFENSPWNLRLKSELISIQNLKSQSTKTFDHIISNPPFFINSFAAPNTIRHLARHTDSLSPNEFFESCSEILSLSGKISIIIPFDNAKIWIEIAQNSELFPSRITHVYSYPNKPIERILIEFSFDNKQALINEICIRNGKSLDYSEAYRVITNDYYL